MSNYALDVHTAATLEVQEVQVYDTFTMTLVKVTQQGDKFGARSFVLRLFSTLEGVKIVNEPVTRNFIGLEGKELIAP